MAHQSNAALNHFWLNVNTPWLQRSQSQLHSVTSRLSNRTPSAAQQLTASYMIGFGPHIPFHTISTCSTSAFAGHATPIQPRKQTSNMAAQCRVYGKRKNNVPRAVFDQKSPVNETQMRPVDAVEAIQSKLAEVTITEKDISPSEADTSQPGSQGEQQDAGKEPESPESLPDETLPQQDAPTEQSTFEASPKKAKNNETILEVRICSKPERPKSKSSHNEENAPITKRRAQRQKTPIARRSSGFIHDPKANTYVRAILNEALSPIASQSIQKFSTWASRSATMFHVEKLAEGSYGEVYKLHLREESCRPVVSKSRLAKLRAYGDGVFKVVPLRAQSGPGSKKFTSVEEIVSEVKMLKYLDPIPGFARFREIHVVQGRFPQSFQIAWDHYKKTKDDCMNPNPSSKKAYPDSQLWAILEMDDAGCELEKFAWSSVFQIYDIFWGVAMALARAEEYALFEVCLSLMIIVSHGFPNTY